MNDTVRPLKILELPLLVQLFEYNNIAEMIAENAHDIENELIDIYALFDSEQLLGELHVKYESEDTQEAQRGKRAYLFAFRIHKKYQGLGLGKRLLQSVLNHLAEKGYSEFTIGVEDDNECAKHIYKNFGFTEIIARKSENYQGDSYEYDLLLKKESPHNTVKAASPPCCS